MSDTDKANTPQDKSLIPQSEKSLAPMGESQIKNLLKSWRGKIGLLLTTSPTWKHIYNAIDAWGNFQMIWEYLHAVVGFLGTAWGSIILMASGLLLIYWQLRRPSHPVVVPTRPQEQTEPQINGEIKCVAVDTNFRLEEKPRGLDCYITINAIIWNDSLVGTTIREFKLTLISGGNEYEAESIPTDGYYIELEVRHPAPWESSREVKRVSLENLAAQNHSPLTDTEHREGWLRFLIPGLPLNEGAGSEFKEGAKIILCVLDKKGKPHKIEDSTLKPCGKIVRFNT